jgi:hypothetical protein
VVVGERWFEAQALAWGRSEYVADVAGETECEVEECETEEMSEQVLKGREDRASLLVARRRERRDVGDDALWVVTMKNLVVSD